MIVSGSTQMPSVTPNALVATAVISNGAAPTVASMWARAAETLPLTGRLRLGRRRREQVRAIYGFARLVQNLGAEAGGDGRMLLDWIDVQLSVIFAGDVPDHPLLRAFGHTIRESRLPAEPLHRLVEVNRRHDGITRFETFGDLIDDCRRTAGPVGELVLHVFGAATPARLCRSDAIWAGLGVTERLRTWVRITRAAGSTSLMRTCGSSAAVNPISAAARRGLLCGPYWRWRWNGRTRFSTRAHRS
jgi:hypothetical protein